MTSRLGLSLAAVAAIVTTSGAQAPPASRAASSSFTIEPLALSTPLDSGEARLTTRGSRTLLSWIESSEAGDSLKFAERTASGWSTPVTITSGKTLMVNAADVPSVHALSNGTLVAQWLEEHGPDPEAYDLKVSRSTDGGRTWTSAQSPHHDGTESQHGFASIFETGAGAWGLIWLDGRSGGDMALRATTYGADGKQREESAIDARVCECCQTSAAMTADGPIVAFRDRSPAEIRDVAVSRLVGGRWTTPAAVHQDKWTIDGCPVNGPSVAASGSNVVVAWFTAPSNTGHVFAAFSADAGRTFGAPIRVDESAAIGRVEAGLLGDGSAVVSFVDFSSGRSQFRVRRIEKTGARGPAATVAEGLGSQYPRMAVRADELVFAWPENTRGTTRLRTAKAALPPAQRRP